MAKRVSDAIGTTTELRAQKNYTGHRLAPWLSHMMVSRQETQRALITPGEVMQLPADEEIVLVSGTPPVRAKKLRYYRDRNFTNRVLPEASMRSQDDDNEPTAWFGGVDLDDEGGNGGQGAVDRPERKLSQEPERSLERPKTAPERDQEPDIGDDDPAEDAGERPHALCEQFED